MSEIKSPQAPRARRISLGELFAARILLNNIETSLNQALEQKNISKIHEEIRISLSNLKTIQQLTKT